MTTTHPMEYPDTGLPVSTDRMRRRVADLIGDGCVIAAFDERLPAFKAMTDKAVPA